MPGVSHSGASFGVICWYRTDHNGVPVWTVIQLALWPIALLLLAVAAHLLRPDILARRRAMTGSCPKCGYSLAGLAAGGGGATCPECGKKS